MVRQLSEAAALRGPPLWRESRMFWEWHKLQRHPVARGVGFPAGNGRPVFLIPGYWAGDASLLPLARALRSAGYHTELAGIRLNVGCISEMVVPLEERLHALVDRHGRKALVIGQSRGGTLGRVLAVRRPDLIDSLMTLGTPLVDPLAAHPLVLVNVGVTGALGSLGLPGLLSLDCIRSDSCCRDVWRESSTEISRTVSVVCFYSRSDGIVSWRACLAPGARHVEVDSSHCGMAMNVDALRALAAELDRATRSS